MQQEQTLVRKLAFHIGKTSEGAQPHVERFLFQFNSCPLAQRRWLQWEYGLPYVLSQEQDHGVAKINISAVSL